MADTRLNAHGVFYPNDEGKTEFSGALFDDQGHILARAFHAIFSENILPDRRGPGRPAKDIRSALGLVAAYEAGMFRQQHEGRKPLKKTAYLDLGYADDRAAREALKTARSKIEKSDAIGFDYGWVALQILNHPTPLPGWLEEEYGPQEVSEVFMFGEGKVPAIGEKWEGRLSAVFLPKDFCPRKQRAPCMINAQTSFMVN